MNNERYKLWGIYTLAVIAFTMWGTSKCAYKHYSREIMHDTITVERYDTIYVTHTDTMPKELKPEKVVGYVNPIHFPSCVKDSLITSHVDSNELKKTDSVNMMPVVQKTFGDDSTYTAYVSGIKYQNWPKLDSIRVRNRVIVHDVVRTITEKQKRSRLGIGIQAGYGYGLNSRMFEPYLGFGVSYTIYP